MTDVEDAKDKDETKYTNSEGQEHDKNDQQSTFNLEVISSKANFVVASNSILKKIYIEVIDHGDRF